MKTSHPLMSLWVNPRGTIQQATLSHSLQNDLNLVLLLTFGYFIQLSLFIVMLDVIPGSYFWNAKGFQAIGWSFLAIGAGTFTYANLTSLILWRIAKWLKGNGSLANTRTGILWSMVGYLPLGFSILLIYFAFNQKLLGHPIFLLDILSLIGFPLMFFYCFFLTVKMIAEIHQFSSWRAFFSVFLCALIQGGSVVALFIFFRG